MAVPILLVSGYLGAGKTTFINGLLKQADGRRIAAIVNDFGAIDIDAALLGATSDGIVSLKNGCICCTLQGDLLRAIANVMRVSPQPDAIVIETSGVSDPNEIVRNLLDPVVYKAAALDAVLSLADARHLADDPTLYDDPLWLAQLRASDFVLVTKSDLVEGQVVEALKERLSKLHPRAAIFVGAAQLPIDLLLGRKLHENASGLHAVRPSAMPAFETMTWTSDKALSLTRFQDALAKLSGSLLRAKGVVVFAERPDVPMLVQVVAGRATVSASPTTLPEQQQTTLVLIGKAGRFDQRQMTELLDATVAKT